jgi:glutamate---cysteine ligase / carboxylate-amine ligase
MARTIELVAAGLGVDALAAAYENGFAQGNILTLGLEEELILVDPYTLEPTDAIESALEAVPDPCITAEFRASQVELVTPVSLAVSGLRMELGAARQRLVEGLRGKVRVLAAGTHPTSKRPIQITDRPRYRQIAAEHPWVLRRGQPSGLHVHVGLGDPDEALGVYNAARAYLPELAALSANSPFFEGEDARLASARMKLVEDHPRSGIPPAFASWRELASFVSWGRSGGAFADLTYLWWDLRLRPDLGTLEFRVADAQTSLDHTAALAAVTQSLVSSLRLRLRAGERLPAYPTHVINENRWRAVRYGLDGQLVDLDTGVAEPARARIARLLLELEPYAAELGCEDELELAWPMLVRNGARRQRDVAASRGTEGLLRWLADETEAGGRAGPASSGGVVEAFGVCEQELVLGGAVDEKRYEVEDGRLTS